MCDEQRFRESSHRDGTLGMLHNLSLLLKEYRFRAYSPEAALLPSLSLISCFDTVLLYC